MGMDWRRDSNRRPIPRKISLAAVAWGFIILRMSASPCFAKSSKTDEQEQAISPRCPFSLMNNSRTAGTGFYHLHDEAVLGGMNSRACNEEQIEENLGTE